MRLLLAGAAGMLGRDVQLAAARAGHETVALDRSQLDVTDAHATRSAMIAHRPEAIVNCAAFTNVDGAEADREGAYAVNAAGAGNLAEAAAESGAPLLHISTDYVFDGEARLDAAGMPRAYLESDLTGPLSVYGASKLEGERRVLAASPRNAVVRSSWLFGVAGANFVETMLRLSGERDSVEVVDDQVGCPTWTGHLAPALIGLLERDVRGLIHLAGSGRVSWNGFAKEIFDQAGRACEVRETTTEAMGRPAPRPKWSALESERDDVLPMPEWQDGLAGYLAARDGMMRA